MTSKDKSKALMTEDEALQEDMTCTPPAPDELTRNMAQITTTLNGVIDKLSSQLKEPNRTMLSLSGRTISSNDKRSLCCLVNFNENAPSGALTNTIRQFSTLNSY